MRPIRIIALTAALGVLAAGALTAQRGPRMGRWNFGAGTGLWILEPEVLDTFANRLELSDAQRTEIQRLTEQFRQENRDLLDRWQQMREEIRTLRDSDQRPNRDTLQAIGDKYGHPGQELQPKLDELRKNVAAKLTPEQHDRWMRGARGRGIRGGMAGPRGGAFGPRWDGWQSGPGWRSMGPPARRPRMQDRPMFRRGWPEV